MHVAVVELPLSKLWSNLVQQAQLFVGKTASSKLIYLCCKNLPNDHCRASHMQQEVFIALSFSFLYHTPNHAAFNTLYIMMYQSCEKEYIYYLLWFFSSYMHSSIMIQPYPSLTGMQSLTDPCGCCLGFTLW